MSVLFPSIIRGNHGILIMIQTRAGATGGGREGASPPHSDYPAPSLKMSVKIDFIYEI